MSCPPAETPAAPEIDDGRSSSWFSFPSRVNEVSARLVASGVVIMSRRTL